MERRPSRLSPAIKLPFEHRRQLIANYPILRRLTPTCSRRRSASSLGRPYAEASSCVDGESALMAGTAEEDDS